VRKLPNEILAKMEKRMGEEETAKVTIWTLVGQCEVFTEMTGTRHQFR
jgi:hypothetical protein